MFRTTSSISMASLGSIGGSPYSKLFPTSSSSTSSSSTTCKNNYLDQEFQLSSDLEEEEEEGEEEDQLQELQRICASNKFTIQNQSDPEEEEPTSTCKQKRIRKTRRKKKRTERKSRSEFVIYSSSKYFTEEDPDEVPEEEILAVEEDIICVEEEDIIGVEESNLDPEFLKDWETHWASHGQDILWRTWNEKYKDYINPNYCDLVDQIKNNPICSDSSSSSEEVVDDVEDDNDIMEGSTKIKLSEKTRELLKRRLIEKKEQLTRIQEQPDNSEMWQQTWNNHCQDEYKAEYENFFKRKFNHQSSFDNKKPKLGYITGEDARNNPSTSKYYAQRYELFSKYDEGIKLDCESWFSVTPEPIAIHIAKKIGMIGKDKVILDAFAGCGGNTIQFAKVFDKVIAIDIDPVKIENCRHNAKIYGVEDKIQFIVGDFMKLAREPGKLKADAVFLSPPWGGPDYQFADVFDINTMIPMNGSKLFETAKKISNDIAYFLPRNVNQDQIIKLAGVGNYVDIESNLHNDRIKTVTAYYGNLIRCEATIGMDLAKLRCY